MAGADARTQRPIPQTVPFSPVREIIEGHAKDLEREGRRLAKQPTNPKRLHSFRKASRRLQAAVDMAGDWVDSAAAESLKAAVTDLTRGTGRHRDADVIRQSLKTDLSEAPADARPGILLALRAAKTTKAKRTKAACRAAARARKKRLGRPVGAAVSAIPGDEVGNPLAGPGQGVVECARRIGREECRRGVLHRFRLAMKSLRYAFEALEAAPAIRTTPRIRRAAREAREITDLLGQYTDAQAIADLVDRVRADAPDDAGRGLRLLRSTIAKKADHARRDFLRRWHGRKWTALQDELAAHTGHEKHGSRAGKARRSARTIPPSRGRGGTRRPPRSTSKPAVRGSG